MAQPDAFPHGDAAEMEREKALEGEISVGKMLRCRIRYFTDGVVIGSRSFVNEAFTGARERFGPKRKDGARKLRGNAAAAGRGVMGAEGLAEKYQLVLPQRRPWESPSLVDSMMLSSELEGTWA